jgi:hypothetical protein
MPVNNSILLSSKILGAFGNRACLRGTYPALPVPTIQTTTAGSKTQQ